MSSLILNANDSPIQRPKDPYWDGPITRYEVQKAVNVLALNDNELTNRAETVFIVVNFLCEKLNITPGEIQAYVDKQKAAMVALQQAALAAAAAKVAASKETESGDVGN
jgi:hypothetical protein